LAFGEFDRNVIEENYTENILADFTKCNPENLVAIRASATGKSHPLPIGMKIVCL